MSKATRVTRAAAVVLVLLAMLSSVVPTQGQEAAPRRSQGYVLVPMGAWSESCTDPFVAAVLMTAARLRVSFHYEIVVSSSTWGRRFTLVPDHPGADIDVVFRGRPDVSFRTRTLGGEHGRVPRGATRAEVCLAVGAPTTFTYSTGPRT